MLDFVPLLDAPSLSRSMGGHIPSTTLHKALVDGRLEGQKIGNRWFIKRDALQAWVTRRLEAQAAKAAA